MREGCRDTFAHRLFNLRREILSDTVIKILEKGLEFAPVQRKINELELRRL